MKEQEKKVNERVEIVDVKTNLVPCLRKGIRVNGKYLEDSEGSCIRDFVFKGRSGKVYTYNGLIHRDFGPAIVWEDGEEEYWELGKRHNRGDWTYEEWT